MKKNIFLVIILSFFINFTSAQESQHTTQVFKGLVSGVVCDGDSNLSLPSVNIAIYTLKDSVLVKAGVSDSNGYFSFVIESIGSFYLEFKLLGYQTYHLAPIVLSNEKPNLNLAKIILKSKENELNEVKIIAETPMTEQSIDRTTINVRANPNGQGTTALDFLQLLPNVNVNPDGTIQIRGSDKVKILMDGRPSMYSSLDQVPSDILDKIEIMNNPSSKYESEGTAGIINLITNKKKIKGYLLNGNLNINNRGMVDAGFNASVKKGKLNLMTNYNAKMTDIEGNTNEKICYFSQISNELLSTTTQNRTNKRQTINQNIKLNIDYAFDAKTNITFQVGFNFGNNSSSDTSLYLINSPTNTFDRYRGRHNVNDYINSNFLMAFSKKFEEQGHGFSIEISNNNNKSKNPTQIYDKIISISTQDIFSNNSGKRLNFKIDYERMINSKFKLEVGESTNLVGSNSFYQPSDLRMNSWIPNLKLINDFDFQRNIHALYLVLTFQINENLSTKIGSRFESTHEFGIQKSDDSMLDQTYNNLNPSFFLRYTINKNQSININYSRRNDRPNANQLNPKTDRSNPLAIKTGNANLSPENLNAFEIKYNFNKKGFEFNSVFYFRNADSIISRSIMYEGLISITSYKNQQSGLYYGSETNLQFKPNEWIKLGISGTWNRSQTSVVPMYLNVDTELTTWMLKLNCNYNQANIGSIQINGNYIGPSIRTTGKSESIFTLDFSVKKQFLNRKLSILVRVSDVFNSKISDDLKEGFLSNGNKYSTQTKGHETSRFFSIGLNFNFNSLEKRKKTGLKTNLEVEKFREKSK